VHRDLKPANLFLASPGPAPAAKVGDFGLAKAFDKAGLSGYTTQDMVGGTPHFMPREQLIRFRDAGPEVDVWAMAASLYNMLTGAFPRNFSGGADPCLAVFGCDPVPIRERDASVPPRLAAVIDEALVEEPEIQVKTAVELKRALEHAL
jgi:serine/threonine protein kinase